ncbi:MAG: glycosyltransferase family 39 protein [Blastocatellales bacterium]
MRKKNHFASNKPATDEQDVSEKEQTKKSSAPNRSIVIVSFAIAVIFFLTVYLSRLDRIVGLFVDDAWYVLLAKSLATGQGYQLINSPSPGILPVYPPVYPFLLSLVYRLSPNFPDNVMLLKSVSIVAMFIVGWASYRYFTRDREWPHLLSLVCALTVALMPSLVFMATSSAMSECVFMMFQLLSMLAVESAVRNKSRKAQFGNSAVGGALAAIAFLTRSIGLAVIAAAFIYLLKDRKWKLAAVFALTVMVVAGPWMVYSRTHQPTSEQRTEQGGMIVQDYTTHFWQQRAGETSSGNISLGSLPERMWANAMKIAGNNIATIFVPAFYRSPKLSGEEALEKGSENRPFSYLLSLFLLLGFVLAIRRGMKMAELITAFTLLITCAWPWDTFRFLLPLMPFLLFYLLESFRGIREFAREKFQVKNVALDWRTLTIAAGLILALFVFDHVVYLSKRSDLSPAEYLPWRAIFEENEEALKWMREKTPKDVVIASLNPALVYLYTGRKTVASNNPDGNWENWKRLNVRYLAYISVYPVGDPGIGEGRFDQAFRSGGRLKLRVMDLGRPETRLPWSPFNSTGSIKFETFK